MRSKHLSVYVTIERAETFMCDPSQASAPWWVQPSTPAQRRPRRQAWAPPSLGCRAASAPSRQPPPPRQRLAARLPRPRRPAALAPPDSRHATCMSLLLMMPHRESIEQCGKRGLQTYQTCESTSVLQGLFSALGSQYGSVIQPTPTLPAGLAALVQVHAAGSLSLSFLCRTKFGSLGMRHCSHPSVC